MKPYDFKWTRFYEENAEFRQSYAGIEIADGELVICSTVMDGDHFSVLTTRRLVTKENGLILSGNLDGAVDKLYGDFKGALEKTPFTFGAIRLGDGTDLRYYIEVGRASMVMIYGVRTWLRNSDKTDAQMDVISRAWTKREQGRQ